jgi:hypothetical protein
MMNFSKLELDVLNTMQSAFKQQKISVVVMLDRELCYGTDANYENGKPRQENCHYVSGIMHIGFQVIVLSERPVNANELTSEWLERELKSKNFALTNVCPERIFFPLSALRDLQAFYAKAGVSALRVMEETNVDSFEDVSTTRPQLPRMEIPLVPYVLSSRFKGYKREDLFQEGKPILVPDKNKRRGSCYTGKQKLLELAEKFSLAFIHGPLDSPEAIENWLKAHEIPFGLVTDQRDPTALSILKYNLGMK